MNTLYQSRLDLIGPPWKGISFALSFGKSKRAASLILGVFVASLFLVGIPQTMAQTAIIQGTPNGGFFSFSLD
jgi:hypothetical protein